MSEVKITPELIAAKNKQRAALRREYLKEITSPYNDGKGHIFDPAVQRYLSLRTAKVNFFKETPKTVFRLVTLIIIPIGLTIWMLKHDRSTKEHSYRTGQVAYKDRLFKFV